MPDYFVGARWLGVEERDGPDMEGGEVHETKFIIVRTSKGEFTVVNHNEHNGYYGGFSLSVEPVG